MSRISRRILLGAIGLAVSGAASAAPAGRLPAARLAPFLPEAVQGLPRESLRAEDSHPLADPSAHAMFRKGDQRIGVTISDAGPPDVNMPMTMWSGQSFTRETDSAVERVFLRGDFIVREYHHRDGHYGEMLVILPNGIVVDAKGDHIAIAVVREGVFGLDLAGLAALARP